MGLRSLGFAVFLLGVGHAPGIAFLAVEVRLEPIAFAIKHMVQVVGDARATQFHYGFLFGPKLGEGLHRVGGGTDPFGAIA